MSDVAVAPELKERGDKIAGLTLKQAKELLDAFGEVKESTPSLLETDLAIAFPSDHHHD